MQAALDDRVRHHGAAREAEEDRALGPADLAPEELHQLGGALDAFLDVVALHAERGAGEPVAAREQVRLHVGHVVGHAGRGIGRVVLGFAGRVGDVAIAVHVDHQRPVPVVRQLDRVRRPVKSERRHDLLTPGPDRATWTNSVM